jgi:Sulfatase-modifying factor enzyme 1
MQWTGHEYDHIAMKDRLVKGVFTVVGAVAFSTLGIYASDSIRGVGQLAGVGGAETCAEGAIATVLMGKTMCVDAYEASPSRDCPHPTLSNTVQSEENANTPNCHAVSLEGKIPWNFISLPQAQRMCAGAGKRLPTSEEWYYIALGTKADLCTIQSERAMNTGNRDCVSSVGAYDVVGNVWEWVNEEVQGNMFNNRELPGEGYVTSVDAQGIAITTGNDADSLYGNDYMWSKDEGVFGMIRGGFYGSKQDAGLYSVNTSVQTGFATPGVGFRCVKDLF